MAILRRQRDRKEVLLAPEYVVGRMPTCQLCLDLSFVSLAHALLRWNGAFWELRDLGSRNGTFVGGARSMAGQAVRVSKGAVIAFGDPSEAWELACDLAPLPSAVPLDGGTPSHLLGGVIAIPDSDHPLATLSNDGECWFLETDAGRAVIETGGEFAVAGRAWRLDCPSVAATTWMGHEGLTSLGEARLMFSVSRDEEHVALSIHTGGKLKKLGEKAAFYLAMVLARRRLQDRDESRPEPGWVDVDTLLQMIPDYGSDVSLNVEIYRFRRALGDAGVRDAVAAIERRRGQVRLGTDRVDVVDGWKEQDPVSTGSEPSV
jgi:hypothetical protein